MLNKKECRKFAAPVLNLDPDNGLLYASQVDYIVCTDIQPIDGQPVLILYICSRQDAAEGDYRPVWTMYQGPEDYITLERGDDGKTKWRTAAFEKLFRDNYLGQGCAFYSAQDERRVGSYFKAEGAQGFSALIKTQDAYIAARRKDCQLAQERKIIARMDGLPALPDGLEEWTHREILPGYFFYDHARKGVAKGTCSACDHEITLEDVRYNGKAVCPHCGRELTMKPRGRAKRLHDRETCQVVQRTAPGELMIRILKATAAYEGDGPISGKMRVPFLKIKMVRRFWDARRVLDDCRRKQADFSRIKTWAEHISQNVLYHFPNRKNGTLRPKPPCNGPHRVRRAGKMQANVSIDTAKCSKTA